MTQDPATLVPLLAKSTSGGDLTADEAKAGFYRIMAGEASAVRVGALISALQAKGVAPAEIAGGVRALRSAMPELEAARDA